jgi:benzylsuccinate CoA-transferase BbsF subunit
MRLPLEGVRILDLCWVVAGPLASRPFADFGADVIKIESALRPDVARGNRVPLYGVLPGDANRNADTGGYFQDVNAGKRSCTLNLASEDGRELLARLAAKCDAIICNLAGDQLDRWGLTKERLRELNPGIIVVLLPAMAGDGPRARWKGFGGHFASASGMMAVSGEPDEDPLPFGHAYPDFGPNPLHAAIALIAALHRRRRTGEGAFIEVSQYESTTAFTGTMLLEHAATGVPPGPIGNADPVAVPHNVYRCAGDDSWCAIAVYSDEQWAALAALPGLETLCDPALRDASERRRREAEIDEALEAWTLNRDRQELAAYLQARGVPAGPMQGIREIVELDPTLSAAHFARLPHPVGREFLVHRSPLHLQRRPPTVALGPLLGADTHAVLIDIAGLTLDEVAEYAARGALD